MTDNWGAHNYTYDAAGQLTGADNPGAQPDEAYTYDLLGNRISGGYGGQIHDGANRLTSDNKFLYAYDANGNLTAKTERALGTATTYSWDAEHRLRAVHLPNGQTETFRYDPVVSPSSRSILTVVHRQNETTNGADRWQRSDTRPSRSSSS